MLMKKGKLKGNLVKGHFLPNEFSSLLNQFAKFDITREIYETVDINTNINKLILSSTVKMKSKNTQIDVTRSTLDLGRSTIDALVNTKIKKTQFALKVKGKTSNPKISIDSKDLIKNQLNKQIDKNKEKIKEKLNKVLKGKLGEDGAEEILKNFKSLF
jgi:ribosome-associated translation inhibitor RaiA